MNCALIADLSNSRHLVVIILDPQNVFGIIFFSSNESATECLEEVNKHFVIFLMSRWTVYSRDSKIIVAIIIMDTSCL